MSFHEVRFPDNIAYGATGGPEFATTVVATGAGHEKRNVNWSEARGRWDVASGLKKQAQIGELIAFFRARRDKAYGFRFKDWTDYEATDQLLGAGDDGAERCPGPALHGPQADRHASWRGLGTITFGIGASAGTFAKGSGGAETFAAGDRLAIINKDPADATLADLSITFLGKRT
jgi:hypothetical protein